MAKKGWLIWMPLLFLGCNGPGISNVTVFDVPNKLIFLSDTSIGLVLASNPTKRIRKIVLCSKDSVFRKMNWNPQLKKGDTIKIGYHFNGRTPYYVFVFSTDLQNEYFELHDRNFLLDFEHRSIKFIPVRPVGKQ